MYLKVDIPEHFQFRIVRSLKDMRFVRRRRFTISEGQKCAATASGERGNGMYRTTGEGAE